MGDPQEDLALVAQTLRLTRGLRKITQAELAGLARVGVSTVCRAELGQRIRDAQLRKICEALKTTIEEVKTIRRFQYAKTAEVPYVVHHGEEARWYSVEDHRRRVPEDNETLIQDWRERRRLGKLGLAPFFLSGMNFFMPRGPGLNLFEVYGKFVDITMPQYRDAVYFVVRGSVIITFGDEKIYLTEGSAIGYGASTQLTIEPEQPITDDAPPPLLLLIGANRIGRNSPPRP
jgi:transcriptional regulator with XRE-family HTH domain